MFRVHPPCVHTTIYILLYIPEDNVLTPPLGSSLFLPAQRVIFQSRMWKLFARHTTMTLIILYLVYTHVSTVVSDLRRSGRERACVRVSANTHAPVEFPTAPLTERKSFRCRVPLEPPSISRSAELSDGRVGVVRGNNS